MKYFLSILVGLLVCFSTFIQAEDILGKWSFNEGEGATTADSSLYGNNGTLTEMDTSNCWINGKTGKALEFDGVDDYVSLDHSVTMDRNNATFECWFNVKQSPAGMYGNRAHLIGNNSKLCKYIGYRYEAAMDKYRIIAESNTNEDYWTISSYIPAFSFDTWYHLVLSADSGVVKTYLNGAMIGVRNVSDNMTVSKIGGEPEYYENWFNGRIDDIRIYNRALSAEEIYQHYHIIGKWGFDGNILDLSGNDNLGKVIGTTTYDANGKVGKAFDFDGVTSIDCGNNSCLSIADNISVELWFHPKQWVTGYATHPISKWSGTSDANYVMYFFGDTAGSLYKKIRFYANAEGTWMAVSPLYLIPALNTWYHIVWTYSSTDGGKLYINGTQYGSATGSGILATTTASLKIGKSGFTGLLDEVKIYNRALVAEEISQHYLEGSIINEWHFDEGTNSTTIDSSYYGNDGILKNMDPQNCWIDGRLGQALEFDGVDDYVSLDHSVTLDRNNATFECWFNVKQSPAGMYGNRAHLIGNNSKLCKYIGYRYEAAMDKYRIIAESNTNEDYWTISSYIPAFSFDTWYHLVLSADSGVVKTYLNGAMIGVRNVSDNMTVSKIGGEPEYCENWFNGRIDDINIYDRALSGDEINLRYAAHGGIHGFGCEANPTGDPIGGGEEYSDILLTGDYIVSNKTELLNALTQASAGKIIYVAGNNTIDLTGERNIMIAGGVTLASNRGHNGSQGALLYTDLYDDTSLFKCGGMNVRVTGLRLRGPDPEIGPSTYYRPLARGVSSAYSGLEVDNCEISAWSHAGIILLNGGTDAYIHHNYIHHCQRYGLGYGVCHSYGIANSLIEANIFDWCRHCIAGTGTTGNSYEACYNYILENANGHSFDMHGGWDRKDGTDISGDTILIHHNTFTCITTSAIVIRGIPNDGAWIYNNWFFRDNGFAAVHQSNAYGNMDVYLNIYTPYRKPELGWGY